ncbi:MAG: preprotein translocase subunit SecG [Phycisphaerae bacterium]
MTLLAANMTGMQTLLAWLTILVCGLLMLVIMLQRGRGGGLAGAFGGGGGSSAFGAKTGDVFTWITVVVAIVFLLLAVLSNYAFDRSALAETPASVTAAGDAGNEPGSSEAPSGTTGKTITIEQEIPSEAKPATSDSAAKDQGESKTKAAPNPAPTPAAGGAEGEDWKAEPPSTKTPSDKAPDAKTPELETKPNGGSEGSSGQ